MNEKEFKDAIVECKSKDEIKKIAQDNNLTLDDTEINALFNGIERSKEVADEELEKTTGGYNAAQNRDVYRWEDTAYDSQASLRVGDRVTFHWHPFYRQAVVTRIAGKDYTGFNGYQYKYEVSFVEYNFFSADTPRTGIFFDYELMLNNDGRFM